MTTENTPTARTPDGRAYFARLYAVIGGAPACGKKGPHYATCILEPDHGDDHEGNGYDSWGPKYFCWSTKKAPRYQREASS